MPRQEVLVGGERPVDLEERDAQDGDQEQAYPGGDPDDGEHRHPLPEALPLQPVDGRSGDDGYDNGYEDRVNQSGGKVHPGDQDGADDKDTGERGEHRGMGGGFTLPNRAPSDRLQP